MKKSLLFIAFIFGACAPTTRITGSWKNTTLVPKVYNNIFVAALTGNTIARSTTESDISNALVKTGVKTSRSLDEFPPSFGNDSTYKSKLIDHVQKKGIDGILTVSLLKKSTESRYEQGSYAYAPASRFMYYNNFWGYYNYWQPYAYSPGYYNEEEVYYLETNLYDSASEVLIWSAQSQTYSYNGLAPVSKEFAAIIVDKMIVDGILPGIPKKKEAEY